MIFFFVSWGFRVGNVHRNAVNRSCFSPMFVFFFFPVFFFLGGGLGCFAFFSSAGFGLGWGGGWGGVLGRGRLALGKCPKSDGPTEGFEVLPKGAKDFDRSKDLEPVERWKKWKRWEGEEVDFVFFFFFFNYKNK